jgi:hypothetical protein
MNKTTTATVSIANQIYIIKLEHPKFGWGDWHDKPLKYQVFGPNGESQLFSTKKAALTYKAIRTSAVDQGNAISAYARS